MHLKKKIKKFRIKEPLGSGTVVEKTDGQNCRLWVFQKLQRTARFRENPSQDPTILGKYI
jgi:hypothetical protein